jgi:hypothetical protein
MLHTWPQPQQKQIHIQLQAEEQRAFLLTYLNGSITTLLFSQDEQQGEEQWEAQGIRRRA